MDPLLIAAILTITSALVLYTIGVFGERRAGTLRASHLVFFWLGFVCDTVGTTLMSVIAQTNGAIEISLHAVSGVIAIALMFFHATWATVVIIRDDERWRSGFHRLSITVWLFWLIPYGIGMFLGIPAIHMGELAASATAIGAVIVLALLFHARANINARRRG